MSQLKHVFIISCLLSLFACGGGGGNSGGAKKSSAAIISSSVTTSSISSTTTSSSSASLNSSGLSVSSASSAQDGLTAPKNLSGLAANGSVTLSWSSVPGATSYHVYYATENNILPKSIAAFENGALIENVSSPYTVTGLQNNRIYYFVVTAVNTTRESTQSAEVSAIPNTVNTSAQPTPQEVLVVELINRARFDPLAEATRYEIGLNDGITGGQITTARKHPVAINLLLTAASRVHSQWMLDNDIFSHTGAGGNSPTDRMQNAGYLFTGSWSNGENIAWAGTTAVTIDLTQYAFNHHEGLFKSPGHRINILAENFREVGVGQKQGDFIYEDGKHYLSSMLTEDFATSGSKYFLTGVIYSDNNNNQFYDVGEGLNGVAITINGSSYPVYAAGAYAIPLSNGAYDVMISGSPFTEAVNYDVIINGSNVKLDVIKSSATVNVVSW